MQEFWDWVSSTAWLAWVALAIVLGIVETVTLDFVFIMLAGGAAGAAIVAVAGFGWITQALVAIGLSVALLGFVRPIAKRHMRAVGVRTGAAALVGRKGVVVEQVDAEHGLIKLAGEVWTARCYDGQSVIEPGRNVDVIEIDGATALVFAADGP